MKVQETGFVEFVTDLIGSTIDAVISSQLDQEKKQIELKQDLLLTREQFIFKYDLINKAKSILGPKVTQAQINNYVNEYIVSHKEILKQYFDKNSLKVIVDRGKVNAKLIFSFPEDTDESSDKKTTNKTKPTLKLDDKKKLASKSFTRITSPKERIIDAKMNKFILENKNLMVRDDILKGKKMVVKPVDTGSKDMLDLKTDIVSNVEFSFRTIVE